MNFDNLIGNNKTKLILEKILKSDNLIHSYMFIGTEGIGKSKFAKIFAKKIMCVSKSEDCNKCDSCIKFDNNNNPDFTQIDSDGKIIKIEQIRQMQERIIEKPIISQKKVYIINDADLMTPEAQNCLLKTLEEPPEYTIIILIVENESKILPTIKSRCMKINFENIEPNLIKNYLQENCGVNEVTENILYMCNGSIGKAISIKDNIEAYKKIEDNIKCVNKKNKLDFFQDAKDLFQDKEQIKSYLEYTNVILYNMFMKTKNIQFLNSIDIVEKTMKNLSLNSNYDMSIDNLLLKLWEEVNEEYNWG